MEFKIGDIVCHHRWEDGWVVREILDGYVYTCHMDNLNTEHDTAGRWFKDSPEVLVHSKLNSPLGKVLLGLSP